MLSTILVLFFASCIFAGDLACGPNQRVDNCPTPCPSDYCPTKEGEKQLCLQPSDPSACPPPACKCIPNFRLAANGTCIPTRQCPAFDCPRINEVYTPCPLSCPTDSCTQASPSGACPSLGVSKILLICNPSCRCKKGFWRVENGTCVAYNDCPGVTKQVDDCEKNNPSEDAEMPPSNIFDFIETFKK